MVEGQTALRASYTPKEWNALSTDKRAEVIAEDMKEERVQILKIPACGYPGKFNLVFACKEGFSKNGDTVEDYLERHEGEKVEKLFAETAMLALNDPALNNVIMATLVMNHYNGLIHNNLY